MSQLPTQRIKCSQADNQQNRVHLKSSLDRIHLTRGLPPLDISPVCAALLYEQKLHKDDTGKPINTRLGSQTSF